MPKLIAAEVTAEYFEFVCAGASFVEAARAAGVAPTTGRDWWRRWGLMELSVVLGPHGALAGSPPPSPFSEPADDSRVRRLLSSEDRAVISACVRQAKGAGKQPCLAEIGRLIGRHRSVVKRELERNASADGSYWAPVAHRAAHERRRRPKQFRLLADPALAARVEAELDQGWSPKLIATMLRQERAVSGAGSMMGGVSHETIYQALYVQSRGELRQDLHRKLSLKRSKRVPRGGERRNYSPYREALKISVRPPSVEDRAVPGHWEGDLIKGTANGSQVGTLVERTTRFVMLLHLPAGAGAEAVAAAMVEEMSQLPAHLRRSLTWDRGTELAGYRDIQLQLQMPVYFCDPHKPWQRGSNENTNRLLRHWLEKGTDLSQHSAADLRHIADTLNRRPRPTLSLQTPAQALAALLANQAAA